MGDVLTKEEDRKVRSLRERLRVQGGTMTADSFLVTKDESLLLSMVDRLVSEIDRLREASKAVFACIECDGEVKADEDGCCSNCGSDCFVLIGLPEEREILRHDISARFEAEIERLRARNEALEKVAKLAYLRWPHIVTPCACCEDLRRQWKALAEPGKGGAT